MPDKSGRGSGTISRDFSRAAQKCGNVGVSAYEWKEAIKIASVFALVKKWIKNL